MSSELELLKQRITELEAENAELRKENTEISYLRNKLSVSDAEIAELKRRNTEFLRANKEHNERRDAENAELRAENVEFRDRLTKVEQKQTLNDNSSNIRSSNFNSVADQAPTVIHHEKPLVDTSLPEDKETDAFLDEVHKKKVSNEIRQRNREKKLLRESATQDSSSVMKDKKSHSHKKREAENIVQDAFDFTATSAPEKNHVTKFSMTGNPLPVPENTDEKNSVVILSVAKSKPLLNLACLYQKACDAEKQRIRANQDEILCWYHYVIEFDNQVKNVMKTNRIGEKKAKGQIYDFIIAQLGTKRNTLLKQTQRARKIYELFEEIGIDKVKYIKTYSANSLSELSDIQIQTIIDYFSKNPDTELPDDRDGPIIDSEEEISNDQDNVLKILSPKESTAPIPLTHVSTEGAKGNSSDDSSKIDPVNSPKAEVSTSSTSSIIPSSKSRLPISILPEDPEEKRKYIIGLVLERFPSLSLSDSSERGERFDLNTSTLCPLCNGDHKEESLWNDIRGKWGDGDYCGERTYRITCKDPLNHGTPIVSVKA